MARRGLPAPTLGAGPLAYPGLRTVLVQTVSFGGCIGSLEVALPAFAKAEATAGVAALAFAAQAVGSACGGLFYGARAGGRDLRRLYLTLAVLLPPSLALIALANSVSTLLLFAALSGCVIAPFSAVLNELTGEVVPAAMLTESFGWSTTGILVGVAVGNAGAGVLVEASGWRTAVLASCAVALTAVAIVVVRRDTLRPLAASV